MVNELLERIRELEAQPVVAPVVDEPPATHVVQALARVLRDMGGIPKLTKAQRQARGLSVSEEGGVPYPYRGIDQIAAAAQPLLGRHGVVIAPVSIESNDVPFTQGNPPKPWVDRHTKVVWAVMGPGGVDDRFLIESEGIGRDNSDKAANKASTGAYKNALLRLLCIGEAEDDPDQVKHETDAQPPPVDDAETLARVKAETDQVVAALAATTDDVRADMKAWANGRSLAAKHLYENDDWRAAVALRLAALVAQAESGEPDEPTPISALAQRALDLAEQLYGDEEPPDDGRS